MADGTPSNLHIEKYKIKSEICTWLGGKDFYRVGKIQWGKWMISVKIDFLFGKNLKYVFKLFLNGLSPQQLSAATFVALGRSPDIFNLSLVNPVNQCRSFISINKISKKSGQIKFMYFKWNINDNIYLYINI